MITQFEIPIYPHIRKWITKKYAIQNNTFLADSHTAVGISILAMIRRKKTCRSSTNRYSDRMIIQLPVRELDREVRPSFIISANNYLMKLFKEDMFTYVQAKYSEGIPVFRSVEQFLDDYGITETEYKKLSAWRAWMRYQEKHRMIELHSA
jgi:hypothetical protein